MADLLKTSLHAAHLVLFPVINFTSKLSFHSTTSEVIFIYLHILKFSKVSKCCVFNISYSIVL